MDVPRIDNSAISPRQAVLLAVPHLGRSWALRFKYVIPGKGFQRYEPGFRTDYVVRRGDWYYVARDGINAIDEDGFVESISKNNAPAEWFLPFAVRVNAATGQVLPPRNIE